MLDPDAFTSTKTKVSANGPEHRSSENKGMYYSTVYMSKPQDRHALYMFELVGNLRLEPVAFCPFALANCYAVCNGAENVPKYQGRASNRQIHSSTPTRRTPRQHASNSM